MFFQASTLDSLTQAKMAYSLLLGEYNQALQTIQNLEGEVAALREQIRLMQQRHFGKKKEAGEPMGAPAELQSVAGYTRKKGRKTRGRTLDTSVLHRHKIYYDLTDDQLICSCGALLKKIGEESSEQLEVVPLRLVVIEHIRAKYVCSNCQTLKMAPKPKSPIPKSLAGGSLITEILVSKYQYHLPLYRQSKILASHQAIIPDNTLGQWVMQSGQALTPLYQAYWEAVLAERYLQVDETPVKILKPEKNGYLWVYYAPHLGKGLIAFELQLTRGQEVPEKRLKEFKGLLQTDAYVGYRNLREREDITGIGCLTHARRKFWEVLKISKNATGLAAEVIERLKPVYALEERMRSLEASFHTRKRLRQKYAWPLLKAIYSLLKQNVIRVPPNTKLGEAVGYFLGQWKYLKAYLQHGKVEIDTNYLENKIRPIAVGRRNWLFMGHEDSGLIHAFWYSVIESATMNDLNPRVYIHYLLSKIHDIRSKAIDPKQLLPHTIDRDQLQAFSSQQIAFTKEIIDTS